MDEDDDGPILNIHRSEGRIYTTSYSYIIEDLDEEEKEELRRALLTVEMIMDGNYKGFDPDRLI